MKRLMPTVTTLLITLLFSTTCRQEQAESKNLEQIYKDEGIPIRIKTVTAKEFQKELSFHSVLSGIKESAVYALLDDEVEKVQVRVGDYVKKDQVLLTFPMDNPAAKYYQAKVAFENADKAYKRMENLYKDGGISRQELDNASAAFEVAKADWEAVKQTVEVKAPISGYITKVNVRETDNVQRDDELFTISRTDKMKAVVWISEEEIFDIRRGMAAYAVWREYKIPGRVVQVDMAMDHDKKAFQALIELNNPENRLKPGTTVEVKIITYTNPEAVVVARKDILQDAGESYVYILNGDVAEKRTVKIGKQQVLDVEILAGLSPGDELIIEGQLLLEPGSKVKVVE